VLAAGLHAGLPLAQATRRAVVAASISTTVSGAREGMPTAERIDAAVASGEPSADR
jgi:sugar/nucleoside kinase (ribokinase family)